MIGSLKENLSNRFCAFCAIQEGANSGKPEPAQFLGCSKKGRIMIMKYSSTRNKALLVNSADAIARGISEEGGLFVPSQIPQIDSAFIDSLVGRSYIERAGAVLSLYLTDFDKDEIRDSVAKAYGGGKFSDEKKAPVKHLYNNAYILELWHGPTCAFKDMALQLLPHLLTLSVKKSVADKKVVILVATSGDTGKAALEGFKDVDGTQVLVFYPENGVSHMQKLQMTTQEGRNVGVCAIEGNFDDAQNGVKAIFVNREIKRELAEKGLMFSSANSINWGRLVPQIVYYFSAYCDLIHDGRIKNGDKVNFVVPTGNFGNILAAYYAEEMGLPVNKLICASNKNNVLTDFMKTGTYNRNRPFYPTSSPSMDILISSNLERLLFKLCGQDDQVLTGLMRQLSEKGEYTVSTDMKQKLDQDFFGGYCDETGTKKTIGGVFKKTHYLCDTHTAVGVHVYDQYRAETGDETVTVIASTASPYKFPESVLRAVDSSVSYTGEFEAVEVLSAKTGTEIPAQLRELKNKKIRFTNCCEKQNMKSEVYRLLSL